MSAPGPHVRGALPWLRSGPLWRVQATAEPELVAFLTDAGYRRLEVDGRRLTDRAAAHAHLAEVFGFPDWYGRNWDAFHDCLHDFVAEHDGQRVAVVLRHLEDAAPVTGVEVGWALLTEAFEHRWSERGGPAVWMDVFAVGTGPDYDGPEPGPDRSR